MKRRIDYLLTNKNSSIKETTRKTELKDFVLGEEIFPLKYKTGIALGYWNEVYILDKEYQDFLRRGRIQGSSSKIPKYF